MALDHAWRKSRRSAVNGNCLEAAWRKSSHSYHEANCTEAALQGGTVLVRDSKLGEASPVLSFTPGDWEAFLGAVRLA